MNIKDLATVALRLIAVILGLRALSMIFPALGALGVLSFDETAPTAYLTALTFFSELLYLAGCIILWTLAPRFAKAMVKGCQADSPPEPQTNSLDIQAAALSILGFYILSSAIPSLAQILSIVIFPALNTKYEAMLSGLDNRKVPIIPWSDIVYLVVRLGLGFWFVLGSAGIIRLLQKVRSAGR